MKKLHLDKYEKDLVTAIDKNEFVEVKNQKQAIKKYTAYFKNHQKKNMRISIRIADHDLQQIQKKAIETGLPYQTLVTTLLHQYAKGKIAIKI